MEQINELQQKMFEFIKEVLSERSIAPSIREIGKAVGLSSTASVQYNLDKLERAGYIERDPILKRSIRIAGQSEKYMHVPLIGTVTAGVPILATEQIERYIPVALNKSGKFFALNVRGDSMINAHILDGDIVIVEQTPVARNGEIVVALIEDEATVKRFYKEDGHFRLQPENDNYAPIIVDELAILGKVAMVIRNY